MSLVRKPSDAPLIADFMQNTITFSSPLFEIRRKSKHLSAKHRRLDFDGPIATIRLTTIARPMELYERGRRLRKE